MTRGFRGFADRRRGGRALGDSGSADYAGARRPDRARPLATRRHSGCHEVARALRAPLDVSPSAKLGVPGHEELAMGDRERRSRTRINLRPSSAALASLADEMQRRRRRERTSSNGAKAAYRGSRPRPEVDQARSSSWSTTASRPGASMLVRRAALRERNPARIVVAVPVGPPDTCAMLPSIRRRGRVVTRRRDGSAASAPGTATSHRSADDEVRDSLGGGEPQGSEKRQERSAQIYPGALRAGRERRQVISGDAAREPAMLKSRRQGLYRWNQGRRNGQRSSPARTSGASENFRRA